ncbi:MAG: ATP-dependent DNA helicase RecG [Candidatus Marinimicrobia bacterium]|nr:ATP-dependent DNA helicase RecG [Candidatus Neomarinimicrobiota bacterium]
MIKLDTEITYLKGVGPTRSAKLKKSGIKTIDDLLYHFPRKYIDRTKILHINKLQIGVQGMIVGKIISLDIKQARKRRFFEITINDGSGTLKCIWFRGLSWISEKFSLNETIAVYGKIEFYNGFRLIHPEFDMLDDNEDPINTGKIISIYPSNTDLKSVGIDSRGFRRLLNSAIEKSKSSISDFYSSKILKSNGLINLNSALENIHKPENQRKLDNAIYRLKFDEHFFLQLILALKRSNLKRNKTIKFTNKDNFVKKIFNQIPFNLTNSQIKVLKDIRDDLCSEKSMNRLIQGDVGCGKTVVALLAAGIAIDNSSQVAIMAPTEILSEQHYNSFKGYCDAVGISCELLIGNLNKKDKDHINERLKSGAIDIIIGTHALIQEKINFKNLGLAIIDEQHRFGVEHRKMLIKKSKNPNVLAMTATPIPRTLSMTLHGDMDISIIDELPKNRIPIITKIVNEDRLESIYEFIKKEMKEKRQCYIVFPIIEESESLDLEAAQTGYENIKNNIFQDYKIGYIHGKMKKDERDVQMDKFINGEINLLVSTTVIEVGIDNPNATVMIIENSERFGLTQLHQLRGRIGRGTQQSYCILVQRKNTPIANHRLKVMENTLNGFKISDEDLKLRGPGEFFGKRQHGYLKTKIADISKDLDIIKFARNLAFDIVQDDCELKNPEHKNIKNELIYRYSNMLEFIDIG